MSERDARMTRGLMDFLSGTAGNYGLDPDKDVDGYWEAIGHEAVRIYDEILAEQGLVVVPKLATPIMTQAAADELNPYTSKEASYELSCEVALNSWQAMIAAAQQEDQNHG